MPASIRSYPASRTALAKLSRMLHKASATFENIANSRSSALKPSWIRISPIANCKRSTTSLKVSGTAEARLFLIVSISRECTAISRSLCRSAAGSCQPLEGGSHEKSAQAIGHGEGVDVALRPEQRQDRAGRSYDKRLIRCGVSMTRASFEWRCGTLVRAALALSNNANCKQSCVNGAFQPARLKMS